MAISKTGAKRNTLRNRVEALENQLNAIIGETAHKRAAKPTTKASTRKTTRRKKRTTKKG
jgi:BMFP domain-containing protein YqiC